MPGTAQWFNGKNGCGFICGNDTREVILQKLHMQKIMRIVIAGEGETVELDLAVGGKGREAVPDREPVQCSSFAADNRLFRSLEFSGRAQLRPYSTADAVPSKATRDTCRSLSVRHLSQR